MQLLDLPLDCFRYLMTCIAQEYDDSDLLNEFLRLRLINRLLDTEVLQTLTIFLSQKQSLGTLTTTSLFKTLSFSPSPRTRLPLAILISSRPFSS